MFPPKKTLVVKATGLKIKKWMYVRLNLPNEKNLIRTYCTDRKPYCLDILESELEEFEA